MNRIARKMIAGLSAAALFVSTVGADVLLCGSGSALYADSTDSVLKKGSTSLTDPEQDTSGTGENKLYNTNYGLHTDKTVSKTYSDGRTFDLDLESWYIGEKPVDVGMVLDASGSMAWTTNTLQPLAVQEILKNKEKELEGLKNKYKLSSWDTEQLIDLQNRAENAGYLPADIVDQILDPDNTDNTKLEYDDYR